MDPGWSLNGDRSPLQPSPCLHSVMARAKADPKFGGIFRFDTPVLMWDQHFTPETWDRLKTRHVPYGWQGLSREGMDLTGMGWWGGNRRVWGSSRGLRSPAEGNEDTEQSEKLCSGARDLDLFPSPSWGTRWKGRLCTCRWPHLVTFPRIKAPVCA